MAPVAKHHSTTDNRVDKRLYTVAFTLCSPVSRFFCARDGVVANRLADIKLEGLRRQLPNPFESDVGRREGN